MFGGIKGLETLPLVMHIPNFMFGVFGVFRVFGGMKSLETLPPSNAYPDILKSLVCLEGFSF